jgi:thioesterase domain-containing protein/acyl carrier protein
LSLTSHERLDGQALADADCPRPVGVEQQSAADNAIENELKAIWRELLGIDSVGVRDDFFALGGHSLAAAKLFEQIKKRLGVNLPLATMFKATTVEQLAQIIREEQPKAEWSSLVAINPTGSRPPLFCVHALGGNVLFYRELARQLGPDQPLYGLQSQGLDGQQAFHERVEDMAAAYLKEIKTVDAKGPYFFVGRCFGGIIAYEMAQQVQTRGEDVALLAILDSGPPQLPMGMPELSLHKSLAHHLQRIGHYLLNRQLNFALSATKRLIVNKVGSGVQKLSHLIQYPFASAKLRRQQQVEQANHAALTSYVAQPYPRAITLIRSQEFTQRKDKNWHLRWSELAGEGLKCHVIEGEHLQMMAAPHVGALADQLRSCMDIVKSSARPA